MTNKYQSLKYTDLDRWSSFWYQIKEVSELKPSRVLEIGVGNKTVYNFLKQSGIDVVSLDINPETKPDIVGSVEKIPFPDNGFDVVLCAEVLEHLPFEKFCSNLREIKRVSARYVILTLPHWGRHIGIELRIPKLKKIKWQYKFNGLPIEHKVGEHYWEIGKKHYPLSRIKKTIGAAGFQIVKDYVVFEMPYHHFFILEK